MIAIVLTAFYAVTAAADLRVERGGEQTVAGATVFSWARLNGEEVIEAGVTIPFSIFENPPQQRGGGPAGAIAVVDFGQRVRETTFLDHFELNWEAKGHEPPVFKVSHFDFHFYGQPVEAVMQVAAPDPTPPAAERIPLGFVYPGAQFTVPQMGVHVFRPGDLEKPFRDILILGYYAGEMTFIEPMVTQAALLERRPIAQIIPVPAAAGKATRYPTRFDLEYDTASGACHLKLSHFVTTHP